MRANVLQLCETALNTVYVKPFCITVVSRRFLFTLNFKIMQNIKKKLSEAIKENGQFFILNEPLNNELIYQIIFDTYFKDLTVEDIKEFVNISSSETSLYSLTSRSKMASFNIKLIMNFSMNDRIDLLNSSTSNAY
jgi:hypothetical protein